MVNKISKDVRVNQPRGCVGVFSNGLYGIVQYYWNYYNGRQFIVINNESGLLDFKREATGFVTKILDQLNISEKEDFDLYVQNDAVVIKDPELVGYKLIFWKRSNYTGFDIKNNCSKKNPIPDQSIIAMLDSFNINSSNYCLNRRAFLKNDDVGVTIEWEPLPSLNCKTINYV